MRDLGGRMADRRLRTVKRPISPILRGLLSLMLIGLVLAGCSGDDDPVLDPTPTTTTPRTAESTEEPTETPTQDTTPDPDPTAELEAEITAFFEEYIDAVNRSWTSKEALERRREMFTDSCSACLVGYEFAERAHAEGLRFDGAAAVVRDVQLTDSTEGLIVFLTVTDFPEGRLLNSDGSLVMEFDEAIGRQTVYQTTRTSGEDFVIVASDTL